MATASEINLSKQMEELLTCCICHETLEEPRTLGCFHSFCKECLGEYVESQRKKAKKAHEHLFDCPLCRTQFQLKQEESVDQIRPCFFINNLLEILSIQQRVSQIQCDACKSNVSAVSRCIECERYLCVNCLTAHNNWPDFNNHDVLTLEELAKPENQSKAKAKPRCVKKGHGSKPLEIYCNTCNELACVTCILLDHPKPQHECEPIDVVVGRQKATLKATSANLQRKFVEGHDALKKIKEASKNMEVNNKKAKDDILQQEKEILEAVDKKLKATTAALIVEVDRKHNKVNKKLVNQHVDMRDYVEKVNGSLEFVNNIIEKGSDEDILSLGNKINENVCDIEKKCPKIMRPVHSGYFEYQQIKSTDSIVDQLDLKETGKIGKIFSLLPTKLIAKFEPIVCLITEYFLSGILSV